MAETILSDFVATHRGLRLGALFGRPAGYAGRRVFAQVRDGALMLRLPPSARVAARESGARPGADRAVGGREPWTAFRGPALAVRSRIGAFLEVAARHAAESARSRSAEELR